MKHHFFELVDEWAQGKQRIHKKIRAVSCPHVRGNMPSGFRVKIQKNIHSLGIDILISSKYLR